MSKKWNRFYFFGCEFDFLAIKKHKKRLLSVAMFVKSNFCNRIYFFGSKIGSVTSLIWIILFIVCRYCYELVSFHLAFTFKIWRRNIKIYSEYSFKYKYFSLKIWRISVLMLTWWSEFDSKLCKCFNSFWFNSKSLAS